MLKFIFLMKVIEKSPNSPPTHIYHTSNILQFKVLYVFATLC